MIVFSQKGMIASLVFSLLLTYTNVWADVAGGAIEVKFVAGKLNLSSILQLQKEMTLSENPKLLSEQPNVTCFEASIDEYLLEKSTSNKRIYGCIFSDQVAMNAALLRAGLFVHTDLGIMSDAQLFNSKMMTAVGGHDFLGEELLRFHEIASIPAESAQEHKKIKAIEKQFKKEILDKIIQDNNDNFILFSVINTKKFRENITHELLHAQYYNVPQIAPILLQVWQTEVTPQDQKIIMNALQNGGYDMKQQELLLREFYSYFLQYNAADYLKNIKVLEDISPLVDVYASHIKQALAKKNIKVITLQ